MQTIDILYMLVALMLGTQICRFTPLFLPKSVLSHPILQKLNKMLPLVIMVLLVLTSVHIPKTGESYTLFIAQIAALAVVIASYKGFNNILLSVALGVLCLNGLMWGFG
ncbi:AzlD domain-containing protein [Glaesserella sp.]|uniref:AzlD domain-containing protein n=1 Tax=Glaesserella sp. TaxID=2094731 RepID=UPI00359F60D9